MDFVSGRLDRVGLDVFLHTALGGFAEPVYPDLKHLWTAADNELVLKLAHDGVEDWEIGERVGRTAKAVAMQLYKLGFRHRRRPPRRAA